MGAKEELKEMIGKMDKEQFEWFIVRAQEVLTGESSLSVPRLPELISKLEAQGLPCHLIRELHQTSVGVNS